MSAVPQNFLAPIAHYGPALNALAQSRYGISGDALLAKLLSGESRFNQGAVSSAGARSAAQFMPTTRQEAISKYGIDPWHSVDEAVHSAELQLRGKVTPGQVGLAGYNPGDPSYTAYVLGQRVGDVHGEAARLGPPTGPGAGAGRRGSSGALGGPSASMGTPDVAVQLAGLLAQAQRPPAPMGDPLTSPRFAAGPRMPQGFEQVPSSGPPAPQQPNPLDAALSLVRQLQGPTVANPSPGASGGPLGASTGPLAGARQREGKIIVAPGANRPGVGLQPVLLDFVHAVSAQAGEPLRIGTGTEHNQYVVGTRNQSDHWTGNAADVPASGAAGDKIAAAALEALGVPQAQAARDARQGGVFTINRGGVRYQVLWKTMVGGNHFNHVHLGAMPRG